MYPDNCDTPSTMMASHTTSDGQRSTIPLSNIPESTMPTTDNYQGNITVSSPKQLTDYYIKSDWAGHNKRRRLVSIWHLFLLTCFRSIYTHVPAPLSYIESECIVSLAAMKKLIPYLRSNF